MNEPRFDIGQEVYFAQNHCALCKKLELELKHPVHVRAIVPFGVEFEYRIEDARGARYETNEACLCSRPLGHRANPCEFCGQLMT
jgi:hypothetical protein